MSLFACAGSRPATLGLKDGGLAPCPATPNCVSSDATDSAHAIANFRLAMPPAISWQALIDLLETLPRVKIISATQDYIHAECSSVFFGFVDDLELHMRPGQNVIAVRSAARLGYGDFGVNRRRVEGLRASLEGRGVIR